MKMYKIDAIMMYIKYTNVFTHFVLLALFMPVYSTFRHY